MDYVREDTLGEKIQFTTESRMIIFFQPNSSSEQWESFQMRQMSQSIKYDKVVSRPRNNIRRIKAEWYKERRLFGFVDRHSDVGPSIVKTIKDEAGWQRKVDVVGVRVGGSGHFLFERVLVRVAMSGCKKQL